MGPKIMLPISLKIFNIRKRSKNETAYVHTTGESSIQGKQMEKKLKYKKHNISIIYSGLVLLPPSHCLHLIELFRTANHATS